MFAKADLVESNLHISSEANLAPFFHADLSALTIMPALQLAFNSPDLRYIAILSA